MTQRLPGHGQTRLQGRKNSSFEDPNQSALDPTKFPGQICPTNLVLKMSKTAGLNYYLDLAGRNSVHEIGALVVGSLPAFCHSQIPSI